MTRRTRYFVATSTAVLALGFAGLLVAYYGGFPTAASQAGLPELSYIPDDASVVAFADVREVMASDLRQRLHAMGGPLESQGQAELERELGINLERDVDHVVACMSSPQGSEQEPSALVVVKGRFDAGRIEAVAQQHGAKVHVVNGKRLVSFLHGKDAKSLGFAGPEIVLIGSDALVRRALGAGGRGPNVTNTPDMMQMVKHVPPRSSAWAVGRFASVAKTAKLPDAVANRIPAIERFAVSGNINGGLSATVRAETRDPEAAQNLQEVVQGFIALAKLQQGSNREFGTLLDSVTLTRDNTAVTLGFTVPASLFDAYIPKSGGKAK